MSITAVPISILLVLAPTAASNGNGDESWLAKWCTRKYAPSAPSSSAATARSMDCSSASAAERVCDCGEGVQWPNERKPIFFMSKETIEAPASSQQERRRRIGREGAVDGRRRTRARQCVLPLGRFMMLVIAREA